MHQPLIPTDQGQSRPASLEDVKSLMGSTPNPRFATQCERFIGSFALGDQVIEFCSSIQDWRAGTGRQGFKLLRGNELVAELLTKIS